MRLSSALAIVIAFAFACVLVACMREGAPPMATVDVTDAVDAGPRPKPMLTSAPPPTSQRDGCTVAVRASEIATDMGCKLDERISSGDGTLVLPCSGDGPAVMIFGDHRFQGTLAGTALVLSLTTEIDWEDGCRWQTRQNIRGEWTRGTKRDRLAWTYSERPISPSTKSSCYGACKATAEIEPAQDGR